MKKKMTNTGFRKPMQKTVGTQKKKGNVTATSETKLEALTKSLVGKAQDDESTNYSGNPSSPTKRKKK